MPKNFIKRFMPKPEVLKQHKHLKVFGDILHSANLWHLNRRSAAGAFAIGLFMAFVPLPCQMLLAAGAAILFRVNLPVSVALVWISNPITMPPMFYACYQLGAWLLQQPTGKMQFELSLQWLGSMLSTIGPAFLLGCLVSGITAAMLGYFTIRSLWRLSVLKNWNKRRLNRQ